MGHYRSEMGLEKSDERDRKRSAEVRAAKDRGILSALGKIQGQSDAALLEKVRLILEQLHVPTQNY